MDTISGSNWGHFRGTSLTFRETPLAPAETFFRTPIDRSAGWIDGERGRKRDFISEVQTSVVLNESSLN
ncbi:MAG: hypothetical protein ACTS6G_05080 [Candidatus Hodgkinia cicadicola]